MNKKILIPVWIVSIAMFIVSVFYYNPLAGARWIQFGVVSSVVMHLLGKWRKRKKDELNN